MWGLLWGSLSTLRPAGFRFARFEAGDCVSTRLRSDVRITPEHSRSYMARELADRLLRHQWILCKAGHEGVARVVKPESNSRLAPCGLERRLVDRVARRLSGNRDSQAVSASHPRRVNGTMRPVPASIFDWPTMISPSSMHQYDLRIPSLMHGDERCNTR